MEETAQHSMTNILLRLKLRRVELGLKQITVGSKMNKYNSWMSKIERGNKPLKLDEYLGLCMLYKKDPSYFI